MAPRGNAPGSFIYESGQGSSVGAASFNTVYMLVDAPNDASNVTFPYNRPMECGSLNIFENLCGSIPTGGAPLISYNAVRNFHLNVVSGDLRVVRVGTPSIIKAIECRFHNLDVNKFNVKVRINEVELGDRNSQNEWLGIPISIPKELIASRSRQEFILKSIAQAIKDNGETNASVYTRGIEDLESGDGLALDITGRTFNGPVQIDLANEGTQYGLRVEENVSDSDRSIYDWVQSVQTSFDDVNLAKGFICAPAAFQIFPQTDRVNLGQAMEELARDADHKWMAMVDCGPYDVRQIRKYSKFTEHDPALGLKKDELYLVKNTIYRATEDSDSAKDSTDTEGRFPTKATCDEGDKIKLGRKVNINDRESSIIEVRKPDSPFNTKHLPATLQIESGTLSVKHNARLLSSMEHSVYSGGENLIYIVRKNVNRTQDVIKKGNFTVPDHGLKTGDTVWFSLGPNTDLGEFKSWANQPSASEFSAATGRAKYTVYALSKDTFRLSIENGAESAYAFTPTTFDRPAKGVAESSMVDPATGKLVLAIISKGSDGMIYCKDHGYETGEKIYFDGEIVENIEATEAYYAESYNKDFFRIAKSLGDFSSGNYVKKDDFDYGTVPSAVVYGALKAEGATGWKRGRKYKISVGALGALKDEAGVVVVVSDPKIKNPWGEDYGDANVRTPSVVMAREDELGGAHIEGPFAIASNKKEFTISETLFKLNDEVSVWGEVLPEGLVNGNTYFVVKADINDFILSNTKGGSNAITTAPSSPLTVTITSANFNVNYDNLEDDDAKNRDPFIHTLKGDENFYCVPEMGQNEVYFHLCVTKGEGKREPLKGGSLGVNFTNDGVKVNPALWNYIAVSADQIINEAIRGEIVEVVERGIDTHQRLNREALSYGSSQGFLAFYGPYVKDSTGVYAPPTPFVTGMALTRYKDRPNGWILPPAGQTHALNGARGVQIPITTAQQDISNKNGLNALRQLPGYSQRDPDTGEVFGPVYVYGARTRANPANAQQRLYQFINTRVILNVIYASAQRALDGEIFNIIEGQAVTFSRIENIMFNMLHDNFYLTGALYGDSADEAFQVIVDDRTNSNTGLEDGFIGVKAFVVPTPTLERIETDLIRVGIGQVNSAVSALG